MSCAHVALSSAELAYSPITYRKVRDAQLGLAGRRLSRFQHWKPHTPGNHSVLVRVERVTDWVLSREGNSLPNSF